MNNADTLFGKNIVSSISFSNDEILNNIMQLYNIDCFDLDCTYSKGVFWKNFKKPKFKTDLFPKSNEVLKACSTKLPFKDNSFNFIMFDPPFIIDGTTYKQSKKGSCLMSKRFEAYYSFNELKKHYYNTLKECYRLLKKDGILVFKCQDVVSSGKNHFSHSLIMNMAIDLEYYPKDLFILLSKNRVNSFGSKWKKQFHARKYHSYFWVLQKTKCKVNYETR